MAADDLNPKNRGLGRGLSALFDDDEDNTPASKTLIGSKRVSLPIEQLKPGVYQPRKEFAPQAIDTLADSIKKYGVLQPILVREISDYNYEIVAGERRWRAAQQAGLHEVPVVIKTLDDAVTLEIALIENLQREDLNPMEEADAYKQLMESFDHTQETLAESLGKSRTHIANTLRLLNLPDGVKAYVLTGKLTAGHARAVLSASQPELLAEEIVKNKLSVRDAEKRAQSGKTKKGSTSLKTHKDVDTIALEKEMSSRLGTKVEIALGKKGGKLVVHYNDFDQLDEFLHRLSYNRKQ
jgi:ParB family chromosome partitioning protein